MSTEKDHRTMIEELVSTDALQKIKQTMEMISAVQQGLYSLIANDDSAQLDLLKIGTVFQIFFIDTLAAGKKPKELMEADWKEIAKKVNRYAVLEEDQNYSAFVFTRYADYIDLSAKLLQGKISEINYEAIKNLSKTIQQNTERLRKKDIPETTYIEACLWLSLEAMIKLLASFFTIGMKAEYASFMQTVPQLAFEYGRYVLFAREQTLLDQYIQKQHILDAQLQQEYEEYLEEVRIQADRFQKLLDSAFSSEIHDTLLQSAELAREAGIREGELLMSVEDIDDFFME